MNVSFHREIDDSVMPEVESVGVLEREQELKARCLSHFDENTVQNSLIRIRQKQWAIYQNSYESLLHNIYTHGSFDSHHDTSTVSHDVYSLNADTLVELYLHTPHFGHFLHVQNSTKQAIISCVDEGTQFGDIEFQLDLDDNVVPKTISTQQEAYILDIAGSGAYTYACPQFTSELSFDEAVQLEKDRLLDLGGRIHAWCKHHSVTELVVTFHKGCGAVHLRCNSFPGLLDNSDFELLESKKCAVKLANAIDQFNKEDDSCKLTITTGLIHDRQICKLRPMNMHNALGTVCILDSMCSATKMDILTGVNFFNVLCLSDFTHGSYKSDNSIDIIEHAVRNLSLTLDIASSNHGWSTHFFTPEKPFLLFFMCKDEYQEFEAREVMRQLDKKYPTIPLLFTIITSS